MVHRFTEVVSPLPGAGGAFAFAAGAYSNATESMRDLEPPDSAALYCLVAGVVLLAAEWVAARVLAKQFLSVYGAGAGHEKDE